MPILQHELHKNFSFAEYFRTRQGTHANDGNTTAVLCSIRFLI